MNKKLLSMLMVMLALLVALTLCFVSCKKDDSSSDDSSDTGSTDTSTDTGSNTNTGSGTNSGTNSNTGNTNTNTGNGGNNGGNNGNQTVASGLVVPAAKYLRIVSLEDNKITIRFNAIGSNIHYDIRYSKNEITEENFEQATRSQAVVVGNDESKTAIINEISADATNKYYIAVRLYNTNGVDTVYSNVITVRAGGIEVIKLDKNKIDVIYLGEVIKDATPLIDEQDVADPYHGVSGIPTNKMPKHYWAADELTPGSYVPHSSTSAKYGITLRPIIDLETEHYVECIYVYYGSSAYPVEIYTSLEAANFDTSTDEGKAKWDSVHYYNPEPNANGWTRIDINAEIRYIQVCFKDTEDFHGSVTSQAPTEVLIYGHATGAGDPILDTTHELPLLKDFMGACGFTAGGGGNTSPEQLACVGVLREYVNLGWVYSNAGFPRKAATIANSSMGNFDYNYGTAYKDLIIVPCLQWNDGSNPARYYDRIAGKLDLSQIASEADKFKPETYAAYADVAYQYAARYGSSKMGYLYEAVATHSGGTPKVGLNYLQWIELGNEPNGEDQNGATPYQLAALTSAAYDGHQRTILTDVWNGEDFTYFFGAKTADPDFKVAMAGLAGIGSRYITSMVYWMKANRTDGCIAMDAFNVHTYFGQYFTLNGQQICVGVSPEQFGLIDAMAGLVEFRDKYYPNVEVWLTEFGWDTNESYETMTSAHSYADYSSREVQAMWLVRAYLLLAASGVDKATMYMVEDGTDDRTAVGKYGTCGIYAVNVEDIYDENGKFVETVYKDGMIAKESYYLIYTLKTALGNMRFNREIASGNEDVWIYEFTGDNGERGYAVWCPTSNDTRVEDYQLYIGADGATLITNNFEDHRDYKDQYGNPTDVDKYYQTTGDHTRIEASNGFVSIDVSENPVYVVID